MTEAQIQAYLPSMAVMILMAVGFLLTNARFSDLNKRIDDLRADTFRRLDRLEDQYAQLAAQQTQLAAQIARLEGQYTRLENQYTQFETAVLGKLEEIEARLGKLER